MVKGAFGEYRFLLFSGKAKPPENLLRQAFGVARSTFSPEVVGANLKEFREDLFIGRKGETGYFPAVVDKKTGRFIGGGLVWHLPATHQLYFGTIYVRPSERGKGVGNWLFENALKNIRAKHPDAKRVLIETEDVSRPLRGAGKKKISEDFARARFWERQGFKRVQAPKGNKTPFPKKEYYDQRLVGFGPERNKKTIRRFTLVKSLVDVFQHIPEMTTTTPGGRVKLNRAGKMYITKYTGGAKILRQPPFRLGYDTKAKRRPIRRPR